MGEMPPKERESLGGQAGVETGIVVGRGHRVMLDETLASLYGVSVRALNQAVKRNANRFPDDFMFRLTDGGLRSLRSQIVILESGGRGQHRKYLSYAFTEQASRCSRASFAALVPCK
jgi:hypothetical protein